MFELGEGEEEVGNSPVLERRSAMVQQMAAHEQKIERDTQSQIKAQPRAIRNQRQREGLTLMMKEEGDERQALSRGWEGGGCWGSWEY